MKKLISKISLITLLIVMVVSLVACTGGKGTGSGGREELDSETFTVTFNSDGGSTVNPAIQSVKSGGKVQQPENPTKPGFKFKHWAKGSNAFNFNDERITANTTLVAIWEPINLNHELEKNDKKSNGDPKFPGYQVISALDNPTNLENPSQNGNWTYSSTYGVKTEHPVLLITEGESPKEQKKFYKDDYFVYFYTMENKVEQRFTTWAEKPDDKFDFTNKKYTHVTELENYENNRGTRIYAKWHSDLPQIKIIVDDEFIAKEWVPQGAAVLKYHDQAKVLNGIITNTEDNKGIEPTRAGYEFAGWQFVKNAGKEDEEVNDLYIVDSTKALDDYYLEKEIGTDNKETGNYTLTIRANWRKSTLITNVDEFITFASTIKNLQNKVAEDPKDTESIDALIDYCHAKITIEGTTFDFSGKELTPIFTRDYPFTGEVVTKSENQNNVLFKNLTLINIDNNISLFGYIKGGKVKGINFEDVKFVYKEANDKSTESQLYVATVANHVSSNSIIENCNFLKTTIEEAFDFNNAIKSDLIYGVIVSHLENSQLLMCNVTFNKPLRVTSKANLTLGLLIGEQLYKADQQSDGAFEYGDVRGCIATADINTTVDNTKGFAIVGGLIGELKQGAVISSNKYVGNIIIDGAQVVAGGLVGKLSSSKVLNSYASNFSIAVGGQSSEKIKSTKYVYVGGLIGQANAKSDYPIVLQHSYAQLNEQGIIVHAYQNCRVYAAGLLGYSYRANIDKCFSLIAKIDVNIYKALVPTDGFELIDMENADNLKEALNDVHLGYLLSIASGYLSNPAKANYSYYVLKDVKNDSTGSYDAIESITLNGVLHKIEMKAPSDNQDKIRTSNFNVALQNAGNSFLDNKFWDKDTFGSSDLYKDVKFEDSRWKWDYGTAPKLTIE